MKLFMFKVGGRDSNPLPSEVLDEASLTISNWLGSGGGASGGARAFCPSDPGSNSGTDLAFSIQNQFSLGVMLSLKNVS